MRSKKTHEHENILKAKARMPKFKNKVIKQE